MDTQFTNLGLSSFCNKKAPHSSYPALKGRAQEVKECVAPLLSVWQGYMHREREADVLVEKLLETLVALQSLLSDQSDQVFLDLGQAERFKTLTDVALETYMRLANIADRDKRCLWPVVPKHHWMWHLAHRPHLLNPRVGNTAIDESFVGTCKTIVRSAANGTTWARIKSKRSACAYQSDQ